MGILQGFTIVNKGLRYKLMLAFSLMSIIPILACFYIISTNIMPHLDDLASVSIVIIISLLVAILGLVLAKGLVDPVIKMASSAKVIASGEYDQKIVVSSEDEIGHLGSSINVMTQKIRSNLDELKGYGQRMKDINADIHKKVLGLSSLLQIGDVIAAGNVQLDSLMDLAVEKVSMVFEGGFAALYMPRQDGSELILKSSANLDNELMSDLGVIKIKDYLFLTRALENRAKTIVDKATKMNKEIENFIDLYNARNIVVVPIISGKRNWGVLIVGTKVEDFRFKNDDLELIDVFTKQMAIAIESDILNKKTEELSIKDDLTDLYNKNFILSRLDEEIKRAVFYQRPCSFVLFNVDNFKDFREVYGELASEEALKRLAKLLKDNMIPVGKAARVSVDEFAMLLPEKNKKEASYIAEDIRKKIESVSLLREAKAKLTISGGVSENPIDGATGQELYKRAVEAVKEAKAAGKNRVVS